MFSATFNISVYNRNKSATDLSSELLVLFRGVGVSNCRPRPSGSTQLQESSRLSDVHTPARDRRVAGREEQESARADGRGETRSLRVCVRVFLIFLFNFAVETERETSSGIQSILRKSARFAEIASNQWKEVEARWDEVETNDLIFKASTSTLWLFPAFIVRFHRLFNLKLVTESIRIILQIWQHVWFYSTVPQWPVFNSRTAHTH